MKMRIFNQVRGLELTEILIIGNKLNMKKIYNKRFGMNIIKCIFLAFLAQYFLVWQYNWLK